MMKYFLLYLLLFLNSSIYSQLNYTPIKENTNGFLLYSNSDIDTSFVKVVHILGENNTYISVSFSENMCLSQSSMILYTDDKEYLIKNVEEITTCRTFFYRLDNEIPLNKIHYIDILYTTKIRLLLKY